MQIAKFIFNLAFLIGLGLYGWASFSQRVPGAPGVGGGGRHLPWQRAEWFTPRGYRGRVIGYALWTLGAFGKLYLVLFTG